MDHHLSRAGPWRNCVMTSWRHNFVKTGFWHVFRLCLPKQGSKMSYMDSLTITYHGHIHDATASWRHNYVKTVFGPFCCLCPLNRPLRWGIWIGESAHGMGRSTMHLCHGLAFIEALSNYMLRAQCLNIFTRNINLFRSDLALVTAGVYLWYSTDGLREQRLNESILWVLCLWM